MILSTIKPEDYTQPYILDDSAVLAPTDHHAAAMATIFQARLSPIADVVMWLQIILADSSGVPRAVISIDG
jgi:hypothetical protein